MTPLDAQLRARATFASDRLEAIAAELHVAPTDQLRQLWRETVCMADQLRREHGDSHVVRHLHGISHSADEVRHAIGVELNRRHALVVSSPTSMDAGRGA